MSSDDGGYVHDPDAFDDGPDSGADRSGDAGTAADEEVPGGFDNGEWLLVGLLVVCLLVIPGLILFRPPALPWEAAFLALPLLPGVALGAVAVWTAVNDRRSREAE